MKNSWPRQRRQPYTSRGIRRVKCIRCDAPAYSQWQVCADRNNWRPLCHECDVALNQMVLEWMGDPRQHVKISDYQQRKN